MTRDLTALSTRSEQRLLPGGVDDPQLLELLHAEAYADTWRIVELFSTGGRPFEAELAWSSGRGVGARALVSVPNATRVGIYARAVQVRARNLGSEANPVGVTIADGQATTRNQWEHTGDLDPDAVSTVAVPPFARAVRLDLADTAALTGAELLLVDATDTVRARILTASQPDSGVLVGAARSVQVLATTSSPFRLVFDLTL